MRVRAAIPTAVAACALALAPGAAAAWKHLRSPASTSVHAMTPNLALRKASRAFEKQPAGAPKHDVSPLLRRLALDLSKLHGSAHRRAAGLLARPTDGASDPQQNGWST